MARVPMCGACASLDNYVCLAEKKRALPIWPVPTSPSLCCTLPVAHVQAPPSLGHTEFASGAEHLQFLLAGQVAALSVQQVVSAMQAPLHL